MKSNATHRIHKQTLDLRFRDFTTLHAWEAYNRSETAEAVRRSIEQCFRDYDSGTEYLTIDKLEFDLGVFNADQLLSKMPEKLYSELQKMLRSYQVERNHVEDAEIIKDWEGEKKIIPVVRNSETTGFLYFLQHGYLPWWYSIKPAWDIEWLQKLTGENWQALRNFFTACFENDAHDENALIRLIAQFNDGFLANLLKGLQLKEPVEKAWSWLAHIYSSIGKTGTGLHYADQLPSLSFLRKHFWEKWIAYALGKSDVPGLTTLLALVYQPSSITSFLLEVAQHNKWMDSIPGIWHNELINFKPGSVVDVELINQAQNEKFKAKKKTNSVAKDDFILVPDAGLVLLHPFLPRLFEHCHWLHENEFVNDEARNRAVHALHYLAAGDEEAPEYVLMLPKLLCGIPLELTVVALPLTGTEKEACDELLVQVIGHWSVLRNTSPAGLRETFLYREGKLFLTDEGSRLEVLRKTEDILLNRLPWGFSMIKFSWMPGLLSVTWE